MFNRDTCLECGARYGQHYSKCPVRLATIFTKDAEQWAAKHGSAMLMAVMVSISDQFHKELRELEETDGSS